MGHITTDCIEDAWRKLNTAENLIDAGQTYAAVMKCENALDDLYRSADSVGEGVWLTGREDEVRTTLFELKRESVPDEMPVREAIESVRGLVRETKTKVEPIINERLDYETHAQLG